MKKIIAGILLFFCMFLLYANVDILSQNSDLIDVNINFIPKIEQNRILFKNTLNENYTEFDEYILPYYTYNFIIPDYNSVTVNYQVQDSVYVDFVSSESVMDSVSDFIDGRAIVSSEPYIFRDYRGIAISFYPYQPDIKTGNLLIYKSIHLQIISDAQNGENMLETYHRNIPAYFSNIYKHFFVNYEYFYDNNITYENSIILTPDKYENYAINLKNILSNNGIKCQEYSYPNDTGVGVDNIKEFIKSIYRDDDRLTFITLIANSYDFIKSIDLSYLYGNDVYPELVCGKLIFPDSSAFKEYNYKLQTSKTIDIISNFNTSEKSYLYQTNIKKDLIKPFNIYLTDKVSGIGNSYNMTLSNQEINNLSQNFSSLFNSKDITFVAQIPQIYSIFHTKKIEIFTEPSLRITPDVDETGDFKDEINVNNFSPLSISVNTYLNFRPLENCLVAILENNSMIASGYTDDFGKLDISLFDKNESSAYRVIFYNKFTSYSQDFIYPKNKSIKDSLSVNISTFPNPYYPLKNKTELNISYELLKDTYVSVTVFNMIGQKIKNIYSGFQSVGSHTISWDGKNSNEQFVSTGTYYIVIKMNDKTETTKVLIIK